MPAGRYAKSFGYSFDTGVSYAVSISSLRRFQKKGAEALTRDQIKRLRRDLRDAFWIYKTDHQTPHSSRTMQSLFFKTIKSSATKFLENPSRLWANRILGGLDNARGDDRAALYRALEGVSGREILQMKRALESLHPSPLRGCDDRGETMESALLAAFSGELSGIPFQGLCDSTLERIHGFAAGHLPVIRAIAAFDLNVPRESGRWPNPALATLVLGVESIWKRVTERTSGLTSIDCASNEKQSLFARWLVEALMRANLHPATLEQVIGIVRDARAQKKEKSTPLFPVLA
jgi:hypothetical protein